jgi:hypothetical protein
LAFFCPVSILTKREKLHANSFGGDVAWNEVVAGMGEGKGLTGIMVRGVRIEKEVRKTCQIHGLTITSMGTFLEKPTHKASRTSGIF